MPCFLIVSATKFEIQPLIERFKVNVTTTEGLFRNDTEPDVSVLITGVGMVNTAFYLGKHLSPNYNYIINAGVCGAINRDLNLGQVVNVTSDTISELGAEDGDNFITYNDLGLGGTNVYENITSFRYQPLQTLTKASAITVNTVHGKESSIQQVKELYQADVESMEGAAFFRACEGANINYLQIRAVSNYVEKRDKSKWQLKLAIENLNNFLIALVGDLNKTNL